MQMQQIARGWLTAELTGSTATALGVVALAYGIPQLLVSPLGGAFADRFEKRSIVILAQTLMGLLALINAALVFFGVVQVWHLFVLGLFQGSIFAFNMPARQAMIAELLGERDLPNGIAMTNGAMNVTRIVAPSIAGILIAVPFFGLKGIFFLIAGLYLVVVYSLFHLPRMEARAKPKRRPVTEEIRAGMTHMRTSPALLILLALAGTFGVLTMPYMILLPIFAKTVHDVGSEGLGLMSTVSGVGALAGSLLVAMISSSPRAARLQVFTGIATGLSLLVFASAVNFPMALVGLTMLGFFSTVFTAINSTLLMLHSSPEYYGRVMSIYMMTFSISPIAGLPLSMLADKIGAPWTLSATGLMTAVVVLALVTLAPAYRKMGAPARTQVEGAAPRA